MLRSGFFFVLMLAGLLAVSVGASAAGTYTYDNQKYSDPKDALKAMQRDLDAEAAQVTASPAPIHARVLIVLPDRDRLRPLYTWLASLAKVPLTPDVLSFVVEGQHQALWTTANTIVRARLFDSAQVMERNDTENPSFDGYDYLIWFQVRSIGPNFSGPWTGQWMMRKAGGGALRPAADPGLPKQRLMAALIDNMRAGVPKLDNLPAGASPALPAVAGGALRRTSSGSGIVVAADGVIVTNEHVVQGCHEMRVRDGEGTVSVATATAHDAANDLALLKAEHRWQSVASFHDGAAIRAGDGVVAAGYPLTGLLSTDMNVTTGTVSALSGLNNDARYLQLTAPVQPGNSGGPLLDMSGRVVGVVSAKLNALGVARVTGDIPQNVNFAIKVTVVRDFLDVNHVKVAGAAARRALSAADVGDAARKFTVMVECWK